MYIDTHHGALKYSGAHASYDQHYMHLVVRTGVHQCINQGKVANSVQIVAAAPNTSTDTGCDKCARVSGFAEILFVKNYITWFHA